MTRNEIHATSSSTSTLENELSTTSYQTAKLIPNLKLLYLWQPYKFEFDKPIMQSINNISKFLPTRQLHKLKLINEPMWLNDLNFEKEGSSANQVMASLEMQKKTNPFIEKTRWRINRPTYTIKSIFILPLLVTKLHLKWGNSQYL